jgi:hypothetical protein
MIVDQKVKVKWAGVNRKHYESLCYKRIDDYFEVNVSDLMKASDVSVLFVCDYCNGEKQIEEKNKWKSYKRLLKQREIINKDCCGNGECKIKKSYEVYIKNLIKSKNTFGDKYPELIKQWSPKNKKTPFEYPFSSSSDKVWWICDKGHEWDETINKRTTLGRNCPYCSGRRVSEDNCLANTDTQLASEWNYNKNKKLTPFDVTCGSEKKVWWICKTCNHEWDSTIYNRTNNGSGCPVCSESKGEKKIRKYLELNCIELIPQKEFKGLIGTGGGLLSYDFYLPKLNILIEYQGEFHDGSNGDYTTANLNAQQEHDRRKREYANKNGIIFIEIWYWDFNNIETILEKNLFNSK